jgi:uncharacterized protein (TIGR00297 family)
VAQSRLAWQSKTVLLLVMPLVAANVVLQTHWWGVQVAPVALWTVSLSGLLGIVAWKTRSATLGAATAGAAITASMMFSTVTFPYEPWRTPLVPVIALLVLTSIATRSGRRHKESLGTAESKRGRGAAQVGANLGIAAIVSSQFVQVWAIESRWFSRASVVPMLIFAPVLAALAEAAADTVSSELGQVLSGHPRMITTLRKAVPGTDGAISLPGTLAGIVAAGIVSGAGAWALRGGLLLFAIGWGAGIVGLFFDSLLGATLERRGWLNNDGVNFLSTASAAVFAFGVLVVLPHPGVG